MAFEQHVEGKPRRVLGVEEVGNDIGRCMWAWWEHCEKVRNEKEGKRLYRMIRNEEIKQEMVLVGGKCMKNEKRMDGGQKGMEGWDEKEEKRVAKQG